VNAEDAEAICSGIVAAFEERCPLEDMPDDATLVVLRAVPVRSGVGSA
jgi:hypothetical protein